MRPLRGLEETRVLAYAVSASNTLDQLGLDSGSSLEISYTNLKGKGGQCSPGGQGAWSEGDLSSPRGPVRTVILT